MKLFILVCFLGGVLPKQDEADQSRSKSRELRRTRFELILKEYEVMQREPVTLQGSLSAFASHFALFSAYQGVLTASTIFFK